MSESPSKFDQLGLDLQELYDQYGDDDEELAIMLDIYMADTMTEDAVELVDALCQRLERFKRTKEKEGPKQKEEQEDQEDQEEEEEEDDEVAEIEQQDNVLNHETVVVFFSQFRGDNVHELREAGKKNPTNKKLIEEGQTASREISALFKEAKNNPDFELDITPYMPRLQPLIDLIRAKDKSSRGKCMNCGTTALLQDELCSPCMVKDRFEHQLDIVTTRLNMVPKKRRDAHMLMLENWTKAHTRYQRTKNSVDYRAFSDLYTKLDAMLPKYDPDPDYDEDHEEDEDDDEDEEDEDSLLGYGSVEVSDNHIKYDSDPGSDEEEEEEEEEPALKRKREPQSGIWQRALKVAAKDESKRVHIFEHVDDYEWLQHNVPLYEAPSVYQIFDQKEQKLLHKIYLSQRDALQNCAKDQNVLEITIGQ